MRFSFPMQAFTVSCSGRAKEIGQLFLGCFRVEESQDWRKILNQEKEAQPKYFCSPAKPSI